MGEECIVFTFCLREVDEGWRRVRVCVFYYAKFLFSLLREGETRYFIGMRRREGGASI